jgi:uncharacterized protein (TIGR03435 family)
MKTPAAGFLLCIGLFGLAGSGQSQTPPAFDVASVRAADGSKGGSSIQTAPGTLTMRNQSLRNLVLWAYDMPPFQLTAPAWMDDIRFDIAAKAAGPADDDQLRLMLRTLLAERFRLQAHSEYREVPVYALTLAKGGPKFHESTVEGPPDFTRGKGALIANRVTMAELAEKISEPLGRPVIDATGLKGRYDIRIDITAYAAEQGSGGGDLDVMSILFNALQAQLGVKLEARKDSPEILIVDSVERAPTEN